MKRGGLRQKIAIMIAALWPSVAHCEPHLMNVDFQASSIEVSGAAWGFIPADFAFSRFEAEVGLDDSGTRLASAEFRFSYLDLTSGYRSRDRKIQDWLEAERFPEGRFLLQRIEEVDGETMAVGQLTLHGETGEARFVCSVERAAGRVEIEAVARIDYRQWGLPTLRVLIFNVDPVLEVRIHLVGVVGE